MEVELKCRNTASSASGLSFARCWLRAEAVGMEESSPQKSSSSWLIKGNKKKGNKFLGRDFFASLEIGIGMDSIL